MRNTFPTREKHIPRLQQPVCNQTDRIHSRKRYPVALQVGVSWLANKHRLERYRALIGSQVTNGYDTVHRILPFREWSGCTERRVSKPAIVKKIHQKKQPLRIFQTGCLPEGRTLPVAARAGVFFPAHCMYVNKAGSPHELWQYNPPAN